VQEQSRVQIGVVPIDVVSMEQAVERVGRYLDSPSNHPFVISGANAHFVNVAQKDQHLASFLSSSNLNVADGMSLVLAARFLRSNLPERITGIDLMIELCGLAERTGRTVYFFGGMEGAAYGAAKALKVRFPRLKIVGSDRPPMGTEFDPARVAEVRERITAARPDFLFVCLGVPRQERWIAEFAADLPVKVVMGNGAALDVLAGFFTRPPQWIQKIGMEWFYRLCIEPQRLWKRYLLGNLQYAQTVLLQAAELRIHSTPASAATR
jgi:N-acetylglucosaminyldiphosphoundecaprenol N-acetyl-beta-D-mannosaminyltransferase